jgi:hypothetical protein
MAARAQPLPRLGSPGIQPVGCLSAPISNAGGGRTRRELVLKIQDHRTTHLRHRRKAPLSQSPPKAEIQRRRRMHQDRACTTRRLLGTRVRHSPWGRGYRRNTRKMLHSCPDRLTMLLRCVRHRLSKNVNEGGLWPRLQPHLGAQPGVLAGVHAGSTVCDQSCTWQVPDQPLIP